jgi:hypothetical protein
LFSYGYRGVKSLVRLFLNFLVGLQQQTRCHLFPSVDLTRYTFLVLRSGQ